MKAMQIGEVAKRSGVGIETIRYYEREDVEGGDQLSGWIERATKFVKTLPAK